MAKFNFENFLNGLNERQKKAVLACKTELELEKVMDDHDIEVPADMLETVTGGKGFMPLLMSGILAFSGAGAAVATAASTMSVSVSASNTETGIDTTIMQSTETEMQKCISDYENMLNVLYNTNLFRIRYSKSPEEVQAIIRSVKESKDAILNIKVNCNGVWRSIRSLARHFEYGDDDENELEIACYDNATARIIESTLGNLFSDYLEIEIEDFEIEIRLNYNMEWAIGNAITNLYDNVCMNLEELRVDANKRLMELIKKENSTYGDYKKAKGNLQQLTDKYISEAKEVTVKKANENRIYCGYYSFDNGEYN